MAWTNIFRKKPKKIGLALSGGAVLGQFRVAGKGFEFKTTHHGAAK